MDLRHMLLTLLLLIVPQLTVGAPAADIALAKRDDCAIFSPGQFIAQGSDDFFLSCPGGVNFIVQAGDGNIVAYGPGNAVLWASNTAGHKRCGGDTGISCYLSYQTDGNLVEYYNGKAIFASNTAGRTTSTLYFANKRPYIYLLSSKGTYLWSTGFNPQS